MHISLSLFRTWQCTYFSFFLSLLLAVMANAQSLGLSWWCLRTMRAQLSIERLKEFSTWGIKHGFLGSVLRNHDWHMLYHRRHIPNPIVLFHPDEHFGCFQTLVIINLKKSLPGKNWHISIVIVKYTKNTVIYSKDPLHGEGTVECSSCMLDWPYTLHYAWLTGLRELVAHTKPKNFPCPH